MSTSNKMKIKAGLNIGAVELNKWQDLIVDQGFKRWFGFMLKSYGKIQQEGSETALDLTETGVTLPWSVVVSAGSLIDAEGNICTLSSPVEVTADDTLLGGYFVYAGYDEASSVYETGTISVDANGLVTGSGTVFTEILRGGGQAPHSIAFDNTSANGNDYVVTEVFSDTSLQLNVQAGSMTVESGKKFAVVGHYTAGNKPVGTDRFIYRADGEIGIIVTKNPGLKPSNYITLGIVSFENGTGIINNIWNDAVTGTADIFALDFNFVFGSTGIDLSNHPLFGAFNDSDGADWTWTSTTLLLKKRGMLFEVDNGGAPDQLTNINLDTGLSFEEGSVIMLKFLSDTLVNANTGNILLDDGAGYVLHMNAGDMMGLVRNGSDWRVAFPSFTNAEFTDYNKYVKSDSTSDVTLTTTADQQLDSVSLSGWRSGDYVKVTAQFDIDDTAGTFATGFADIVMRFYASASDGSNWQNNGQMQFDHDAARRRTYTMTGIFLMPATSVTFYIRKVSLVKTGTITPTVKRQMIMVEKLVQAN